MLKKTLVAGLILGLVMVVVPTAYAQSDEDTDTESLLDQIASLLETVRDLQDQLADLRGQQSDVRQELRDTIALTRDLAQGMSGEDVEELQELLASDPDIYPEGLVTGYFGPLTQRAVERLQERFGIDSVGRVGPVTRGTLNRIFSRGHKNLRNITVDDDDVDDLDDDVDLSEYVPGVTGVVMCHVRGNGLTHTIVVGGPAVQAHLAHGDELEECENDARDSDDEDVDDEDADDEDDEEVEDADDEEEDDDTTAPVISAINISINNSSRVDISWQTDEDTDGAIWYDTEEDVEVGSDENVETEEFDDSHEVTLSDLTAETTYYFIVSSADGAGNEGVSSELSFETPAAAED